MAAPLVTDELCGNASAPIAMAPRSAPIEHRDKGPVADSGRRSPAAGVEVPRAREDPHAVDHGELVVHLVAGSEVPAMGAAWANSGKTSRRTSKNGS